MPGEVMCLLGPSGSGKSTFLRCINHLEKINAGRLSVDGELVGYRQVGDTLHELRESEIARKRAEIGMVFQHFNLFPHMTALENVTCAPIRVKGVAREQAAPQATRAARAGRPRATRLDSLPRRSSPGGQQQRVAIARALAMEPEADALRRAHLGARPRARGRGAGGHAAARPRRHDDGRGDARDGLRARGRRQRRVHGRRRGRRVRAARARSSSNPRHERTRAFLSKVL